MVAIGARQHPVDEVVEIVDAFLADVQPRMDSLLRRMQSKLEEVRLDLEYLDIKDVTDRFAAEGFVALVTPTQLVDRVNYDDSISLVTVEGEGGNNRFILDDTAAPVE